MLYYYYYCYYYCYAHSDMKTKSLLLFLILAISNADFRMEVLIGIRKFQELNLSFSEMRRQ